MTFAKVIESERSKASVPPLLAVTSPAYRPAGAAVTDLQRAAADRGAAGIGVGPGQRRGAGAALLHRAAAGDDVCEGDRVRAVERERAVVGDVARDRPGGAAVTDLQGAGGDRGAAGIGVGPRQRRGAGTALLHRAAARDVAAERPGAGAIEEKTAVIGDVAGNRSSGAAVTDLQRAAADRGAAGIGVGPGQRRRAGADLLHRAAARDVAAECQGVRAVEGRACRCR